MIRVKRMKKKHCMIGWHFRETMEQNEHVIFKVNKLDIYLGGGANWPPSAIRDKGKPRPIRIKVKY